jgi:hypothetical protein
MALDGREGLADDVEETTEVSRVERAMKLPCSPCRSSGCVTISLAGRVESRLCLWCAGAGFRTVRVMTGPSDAESGAAR